MGPVGDYMVYAHCRQGFVNLCRGALKKIQEVLLLWKSRGRPTVVRLEALLLLRCQCE